LGIVRKLFAVRKLCTLSLKSRVYMITVVLKPTPKKTPSTPYDQSGIYAISCITCNKKYVGQTSRSLSIRYKEHARYIKQNNPLSAYALHILNHRHEYGPLDKTMTLLKPIRNTSLLTPYETLFIQSLHTDGCLIPEQNPPDPDPRDPLAMWRRRPRRGTAPDGPGPMVLARRSGRRGGGGGGEGLVGPGGAGRGGSVRG
jgi:hypothetical protein